MSTYFHIKILVSLWNSYIFSCIETPAVFFIFYFVEFKIEKSDTWLHSRHLVNSLTLVFEQNVPHLLFLLMMNWFVCKSMFISLDLVKDTISPAHWYTFPEALSLFAQTGSFLLSLDLHPAEAKYLLSSHSTFSADS